MFSQTVGRLGILNRQKLEVAVKNDQQDRDKQLLRAFDTHLKSPWLMGRRVNHEVRRSTLMFAIRRRYPDEHHIRQTFIACVHVNTSNFLEMRFGAIDWGFDARGSR